MEITSSSEVSATESRTAPSRSKRPRVLTPDSGTTLSTATPIARPTTTDTQNTDDQPNRWNNRPPSGRPSAPPMPSVALINATAEPTRSLGSSSRMMLMPTGISAAAKPCSDRPITKGRSCRR